MNNKSLAVVLIVEGINNYEMQFKLLTYTILKYNPSIRIYAVTPSRYSISYDTKKYMEKYNIFHIDCPTMHSEVKENEENIFTDIIKPKSILLAKKYITEDYILHIDNDTVCFGDLSKILEQYSSGYFCANNEHVLNYTSNNVINIIMKFKKEAKQLYKLISDNDELFNVFPTGWIVLHPTNSDFWQKWVDYILYVIEKIKNKKVLNPSLKYISDSILHLAQEAGLSQLSNEFKFLHIDDKFAQCCYFNKSNILLEPYPLLYNYGGFNQYAHHISHIDYISEFIKINNIDITQTSRGPLDNAGGTVDRLYYK